MRRMTREGGQAEEELMWASLKEVPTVETRASVSTYVQETLVRYADLPLDVGGLHPKRRVEKRWWDYLRWLNDLQWFFQQCNARAYSILPLCSFASKNVTIDTGVLHGLLKRLHERIGYAVPEKLQEFQVNRREHWESCFILTKVEGKNKRRDFEYMVKTDGYSVCFVLSKAKMVVAANAPVPAPDLLGKRVIGVDPGRKDLVSCAWSTEDGVAKFSHYSNKVC